jgi:hypothetical protein
MSDKRLNDNDIEKIIFIIDSWDEEKLTWNKLIDKIQLKLNFKVSRQALSRHSRIKLAFQSFKSLAPKSEVKNNPTEQFLIKRLNLLEAENARLKKENNLLLEQFGRWLYNAGHLKGMTPEQLNRPLPQIDREQSSSS